MKCPFCGNTEVRWLSTLKPSGSAEGMNEVRRKRACAYGHEWRTTEVDAAELADLRRRAYLYERTVGSATGLA